MDNKTLLETILWNRSMRCIIIKSWFCQGYKNKEFELIDSVSRGHAKGALVFGLLCTCRC